MLVPCLQCNNLSKEYNGGHQLEKEARKWATKIAKETKAIREHQRLLKAVGNGDKVGELMKNMRTYFSLNSTA